MRYSETWLSEWVKPEMSTENLANLLTMSGIEVDEIIPVAVNHDSTFIGEIISRQENKDFYLYEINLGDTIKTISSKLLFNKGKKIAIKVKDQASELCLPSDIGLSEKLDELFIFDEKTPVGLSLTEYFQLNDVILNISISPNRGDCLSIKGIAREISALTNAPLFQPPEDQVKTLSQLQLSVEVLEPTLCPRYVGRIIERVNNRIPTPVWLQEKLRRMGARSINLVVDVINYVMFEIGQPMHAFDFHQIKNKVIVRQSSAEEKIVLLDENEKQLKAGTLVIADADKPIAIAGVMGGLHSSVTRETQTIFLESAFFTPQGVAKERETYLINSESAYRFERGVDPFIQRKALERASLLIIELAGGKAGPIVEVDSEYIPLNKPIQLYKNKIKQILGIEVPEKTVINIFQRLHFIVKSYADYWEVEIPSYRFDIKLPEDLVEEIGRLYGYDNIPMYPLVGDLKSPILKKFPEVSSLKKMLSHLGYHEIVSYSFIDPYFHQLFHEDQKAYQLQNPISQEMSLMRVSLLPGLLKAYLYNHSRQQSHIRLFEAGTVFIEKNGKFIEEQHLAMLISGQSVPIQWGEKERSVDFFDLKGDVEELLTPYYQNLIDFETMEKKIFHPGQSAILKINRVEIGKLGALHPKILQSLDVSSKIFVFELNLTNLDPVLQRSYHDISKFPEIRRDIAIVIDEAIPVKLIQDTIKTVAGSWLKELFIFDVYQGKGITPGKKSVALGLILQDQNRTLIDDEVANLMGIVINTLKRNLSAELRS